MEEDQRRVTVRMTKLGEKIVDTLSPLITQQYRNLEQAFGPELIAEVFSVLDRFVDADREAVRQVELPDRRAVDKEIARLMK
jgi:DNA-binding MarR family transcriptional regulator